MIDHESFLDRRRARERFEALVADFLEAAEAGGTGDWHALVQEHPELEAELTEFFTGQEQLDGLAAPLRDLLTSGSVAARAAARPEVELAAGAVLGDYRIRRELGRGGMGFVFEADQISLGRRVALKVLPWTATLDDRQRQRFRQEAQAAAGLQHPHIVPIHEVGSAAGLHFYAMQLIDGRSLADWLQVHRAETPREKSATAESVDATRKDAAGKDAARNSLADTPLPDDRGAPALPPLDGPAVARLGLQAAEALEHAHQHGVIHRDIKPANLLVDARGNVWITDFGLAKLEGIGDLTRTGDLVGTLRFMAPERFAGWSDPRSDIYSLGLTLFELLTLQPAFAEQRQERLMEQILHQEPPRPRKLNAAIARDLETIVLKATAKEPGQRYRTAGELAEDLRLFLADRPIRARRVSALGKMWRWSRRNPMTALLVSSVALLLVVIAAGASLNAHWLALARDDVAKKHDDATENLREAYLAQAQARRFSGQPGRYFKSWEVLAEAAAIRPGPDLRDEAIACLPLVDLRLKHSWSAHHPSKRGFCRVVFDGAFESYLEADERGNIRLRRVADQQEILMLPGPSGLMGLSYSRDGRYVAAAYAGRLQVWDLVPQAPVIELETPPENLVSEFSADSKRLLVVSGDALLRVWDLDKRTATAPVKLGAAPHRLAWQPGEKLLAFVGWNERAIQILEVATGKVVQRWPNLEVGTDLAWSPDGALLAVSADHEFMPVIELWQAARGKRVGVLQGPSRRITHYAFNHRGDLLAATGEDNRTWLWDLATGKPAVTMPGSFGQWRHDDQQIVFSADATVGLWDVHLGNAHRSVRAAGDDLSGLTSVDVHPNGRLAATTHEDGVYLWDLALFQQVARLPIDVTRTALFHPDGKSLITFSIEGLRRWPIDAGEPGDPIRLGPPQILMPLTPAQLGLPFASLSPDGRWLAVVARTGEAFVLDLANNQRIATRVFHASVRSLTLSPDGRWLVTATWVGLGIKVWDVQTSRLVKEIEAGGVASAVFTPDGQWLYTESRSRPTQKWQVLSWEERANDLDSDLKVFSADGALMAQRRESSVALVDIATGKRLALLTAPQQGQIVDLRFTSGNEALVVASQHHHLLHVWDLTGLRHHLRQLQLDWRATPPPDARPRPATPLRIQVKS